MLRTITVVSLCFALAACGSGGSPAGGSERTIAGVIVKIDVRTIEDIESFTLLNRGREYLIRVDDDTEFAFPPGHLNEHRTSAEPVEVVAEKRAGGLYALSIDDATH